MENRIKVVVAEDIVSIATRMKSIIETNENVEEVHYAPDGEKAIQEIINLEADLVFTDMEMPKKTGIEVIETILSYPDISKKPRFILVTSNRDSSLIIKARELGFNIEYKPINEDRIHEYINDFETVQINKEEEERKLREEMEKVKKEGFFQKLLKAKK